MSFTFNFSDFLLSILLLASARQTNAFVDEAPKARRFGIYDRKKPLFMAGPGSGPGWDNGNFLDSLGGDDDDRENASEKYREFQDFREKFNERQKERMNSEAGKAFMEAQRKSRPPPMNVEGDILGSGEMLMDEFEGIETIQGGSRFRQMMLQSKKKSMPISYGGFEQKFVVPLENIDNEDDEEKTPLS